MNFCFFLLPAKSRIPALRDPQAVLKRRLPVRSLKSVIKRLLLRLGQKEEALTTIIPLKRAIDPTLTGQNGDISSNGVKPPVEKKPRLDSVAQNCNSGSNGRSMS